jgi:hypothetical protein
MQGRADLGFLIGPHVTELVVGMHAHCWGQRHKAAPHLLTVLVRGCKVDRCVRIATREDMWNG